MEVGMVKQVLPPRVKDGKETNLRSKMFGIGGNSQHRVGRGSEENAIDGALVLQGNVGNLFRHGKDDMKVLGLEKFAPPVFDPPGAGQRLTFGTVTIQQVMEIYLIEHNTRFIFAINSAFFRAVW